MVLNPGAILGDRYEIIEKIGSGGMAVVYRAKDKKLDRFVTIKVLREEYVGDEEFIERFRTEACAAARLSHPNIVRVYDVGEDRDTHFIVMEYIHGDTLKKAIKEKAPFDSRSTLNVAIQIASALAQAHKSHIVHRDIKPQNILVGTDGVIKVTDFGIARATTASTMTTTANAAGSVHYFSPEQARGGYVDEKSDIYSLGISMYEMITGVLPFQGANSVSIALKHINEELPDIRQYNPNCTRSLEGIIKKATAKKADERYESIDLLLADLLRAKTDSTGNFVRPVEPKTAGVAAGVAGGLAAAAIAKTAKGETPGQSPRASKRAEAAAELRKAQYANLAKDGQAEVTAFEKGKKAIDNGEELPGDGETKAADLKEVEYIRRNKGGGNTEEADLPPVTEPMVSFERYGKKLRLSKEDIYEDEYMEVEQVSTSKRPKKERRNPRTEEDYGNEYDRKRERKTIIAAVVTALVIIAVITVSGLRFLSGNIGGFGGEKNIQVPVLVGVPFEDAKEAADAMGVVLVEEGQDYDSYYDKGYIIYQSVGEGEMVAKGAKIGIKVSLGLASKDMPNLVGKKEEDASNEILTLVGISPRVEYEFDEEKEVGVVLEQTPAARSSITAKSTVVLKVSKGKEGAEVVVPNVVGMTEENAKKSLTAVSLMVGNVLPAESQTVEAGKVITQTLDAGQSVPAGSVVNLVISSGKGETETPETPEAPPQQPDNGGSTTTPPGENTDNTAQGTKYFTIQAPSSEEGDVYVRVVKKDVDGVFPVVDEYRNVTQFPYSVGVTGRGNGTVSCYINDDLQWTQNVNFAE